MKAEDIREGRACRDRVQRTRQARPSHTEQRLIWRPRAAKIENAPNAISNGRIALGATEDCVTGGSRLSQPKTMADATSASLPTRDAATTSVALPPQRRYPSRNSVMTYHDNRSIMLYVTVVTEKRNPILADKAVLDCILAAWKSATDWLIGWYVIMPDHIHFFCAPATYPPPDFHLWMKKWKAQVSRTFPIELRTGGARLSRPKTMAVAGGSRLSRPDTADATSASLPRLPPLFQRDCWDRQLRTGESYAQKWAYVRNNPVRKGLVANADDWPYQGRMNILEWHERT